MSTQPLEDWAQLISFSPALTLRPTSIEELKAMLEKVDRGELGEGSLRVPGSLHSCAEIVVTDALLDTSGLPKEIVMDADRGGFVATANVRLHDLLAELGTHGKSLTATGGTDAQTLAGLISTGTAPASSRNSLYEKLEWVELVTIEAGSGAAVERRIARGDADWPAVVCSLGVLGVLTRVRFAVVDELYFDVVQEKVLMDDVLIDLDATSRRYDFWRVNWMPKSRYALLWAATAVPRGESRDDGDYAPDQTEQILEFVEQGPRRDRRRRAAAGPAAGAPLQGHGVRLRPRQPHRPAAQHAAGRPPRADARRDGRVELPPARHRPRPRRLRGVLRTPRLAEHPDRDRADPGRRQLDVGVGLGRRGLHREVQLHVLDRRLHASRATRRRSSPTSRASGTTSGTTRGSSSARTGASSTSSTPTGCRRTATSRSSAR